MVTGSTNLPEEWERFVANRAELFKAERINESIAGRFAAESVRLTPNGSLTLAGGSVRTISFVEHTFLIIALFLPIVVDKNIDQK